MSRYTRRLASMCNACTRYIQAYLPRTIRFICSTSTPVCHILVCLFLRRPRSSAIALSPTPIGGVTASGEQTNSVHLVVNLIDSICGVGHVKLSKQPGSTLSRPLLEFLAKLLIQ